eukprot:2689643-Rhodomonas_salina.2
MPDTEILLSTYARDRKRATCGTESASAAICLRVRYAMSSTKVAYVYAAICRRPRYAMSGTEIANGATRHKQQFTSLEAAVEIGG